MLNRQAVTLTATLLFASLFTSLAHTAVCQTIEDASKWILCDTAYTDDIGYVINKADSLKITGHAFVGPGPVSITFLAEMDRQPSYCAWEMASDMQFQDVIDQFRVTDAGGRSSQFEYKFDESGTYYVRFVADFLPEGDETFETLSYTTPEPYQIQITESLLEVPNLITPDQPESQNSVFRVRYKSLSTYEIWIHNRWGQELFHSSDPSEGWNGQSGGKTVPTGAYYYLIKAEGTDGINYNKKGNINVLRTREKNTLE